MSAYVAFPHYAGIRIATTFTQHLMEKMLIHTITASSPPRCLWRNFPSYHLQQKYNQLSLYYHYLFVLLLLMERRGRQPPSAESMGQRQLRLWLQIIGQAAVSSTLMARMVFHPRRSSPTVPKMLKKPIATPSAAAAAAAPAAAVVVVAVWMLLLLPNWFVGNSKWKWKLVVTNWRIDIERVVEDQVLTVNGFRKWPPPVPNPANSCIPSSPSFLLLSTSSSPPSSGAAAPPPPPPPPNVANFVWPSGWTNSLTSNSFPPFFFVAVVVAAAAAAAVVVVLSFLFWWRRCCCCSRSVPHCRK